MRVKVALLVSSEEAFVFKKQCPASTTCRQHVCSLKALHYLHVECDYRKVSVQMKRQPLL